MSQYVILISKSGQFRTEPAAAGDLQLVEAWDYLLYGRKKAHFAIGLLDRDVKVNVIDDIDGTVNRVPSKFLPRFDSLEQAREELKTLVSFGSLQTELVPA